LQEEIQKSTDLQNRYNTLIDENNRLKTQLAQTTDQGVKDQLLAKTKAVDSQLTATQWYDKGNEYFLVLTPEYLDKAIDAFNNAIALDPQYADAYIGRGAAYSAKNKMI